MPDVGIGKNIGLQVRYSSTEAWTDVKLNDINLSDDGNVTLSYRTKSNALEHYETSYDELRRGDGTVRFIDKQG